MFFPVLTVADIVIYPVIPAIIPLFAAVVEETFICQHLEACFGNVSLAIVLKIRNKVVACLAHNHVQTAITILIQITYNVKIVHLIQVICFLEMVNLVLLILFQYYLAALLSLL
jgi:hypothetical protein